MLLLNGKNIITLLLPIFFILGCGKREFVYSYVVQNNTEKQIEVVVLTKGSNGIIEEEISKKITIKIEPGMDYICFEHIALPENIVDNEIIRLEKWDYIDGIEVYMGSKKSHKNYLFDDMEFYYLNGIIGSKQGIYTVIVEESDFGNVSNW